jgi:hypothetical protein
VTIWTSLNTRDIVVEELLAITNVADSGVGVFCNAFCKAITAFVRAKELDAEISASSEIASNLTAVDINSVEAYCGVVEYVFGKNIGEL